jgi:GTP-binding protein Era
MPPGPWLYPEDQISDAPLRMLAAEITREKIFERLHDELPYRSTVETESWQAARGRLGAHRADDLSSSARVSARSCSAKAAQTIKAISAGRRGSRSPRAAEQKVHLFLFVKVRENWSRRPRALPRDGPGIPEKLNIAAFARENGKFCSQSCAVRHIHHINAEGPLDLERQPDIIQP